MSQVTHQVKIPCKLVLLGQSAVGKTSCVLRFDKNQYEEFQQSTQGASYMEKNIEVEKNVFIRAQIWDTAGQERYKSLTPMYYRDSNCALIVYDITDYESYKTSQQWVKNIQADVKDCVICLVGNKIDLVEEGTIQRGVSQKEIEEYVNEHGIHHIEVSAKTGKCVNDAFIKTIESYYKYYKQNDLAQKSAKTTIVVEDLSNGQDGSNDGCSC